MYIEKPAKCHLVNVSTGDSVEALFNPRELTEKVEVKWNKFSVPGLGYQPLHYQGTSNRGVSGVEFYLDKYYEAEPEEPIETLDFRNFILALSQPQPAGATPARVLILWPGTLNIEAVLTGAEFRYTRFSALGGVLMYTAEVSFEVLHRKEF